MTHASQTPRLLLLKQTKESIDAAIIRMRCVIGKKYSDVIIMAKLDEVQAGLNRAINTEYEHIIDRALGDKVAAGRHGQDGIQ